MAQILIDITTDEYKELVRDSERLAIIKRMLQKDSYTSVDDIKNIIGIEGVEVKIGRCEEL